MANPRMHCKGKMLRRSSPAKTKVEQAIIRAPAEKVTGVIHELAWTKQKQHNRQQRVFGQFELCW